MLDTEAPDRAPDAVLYAPPHDQALWSLPWIAKAQVVEVTDADRPWVPTELRVQLWFQASQHLPKPQDVGSRAPIPDQPFDLQVYNAGEAPPEGFWQVHPALEAFEVEYDPDDGGDWWARLWLKAD
jgi:hypothetical protein